MKCWNQDAYIKAWNFASYAHNGQLVPGTQIPYINHIGLVAMECMGAVVNSDVISNPDLFISCALLHDTIEDTTKTYDEIVSVFGVEIADGVLALSKDKSLPSKREQMIDSIKRIKCQPQEIWMVKLSDRITNLQPPPKHWDNEKIAKYRSEALFLLEELGESNNFLASRLKLKATAYKAFLL